MFAPSDFELKLEEQLKLRVITDDIEKCNDIEALKLNLIKITTLFMKYQHLLNVVLARQIEQNIAELTKSHKKSND